MRVLLNGLSGLLMPIRAVGQFSQNQVDLRTTISELVPLNESPNSLGLTITIYRVSLIWGILWIVATMGRVSLLRILVFVLAALAAWTNQRSIGFFGVAFMLLHTGAGSHPWRLSLPGNWPSPSALLKSASGLVLTLLLAGLLWPQIIRDDFYLREGVGRRFGDGVTPARYPSATAGTLARLVQPQCFANLDAAGFLLANTSGSVFIDGRTEAYSADLWAEYLKVKRGDEFSLAILAKRRVDAVCLATAGASFDPLAILLLDSVGWKLVAAEGGGLLFQPQGRDTDPAVRGDSDKAVLTRAGIRTLAAAERGSPTRKADFCLAAGHLFMFAGDD